MKELNIKIEKWLLFFVMGIIIFLGNSNVSAQNIKWFRISDLQSPFNDLGAEYEGEFNYAGTNSNYFAWPAKYGIDQNVMREQGVWIGCKDFDDPVEGKIKSVKVIGSGPQGAGGPDAIFPVSIKMIGKFAHPSVTVDDQLASLLDQYDQVDEYDPNLPCDRMIIMTFNTSMGVTVTKKIMVFANSEHGNYFIFDYVFKNTGIYNTAGNVKQQTLKDAWLYFFSRHAFAGVSSLGFGSTWGAFASLWGTNNLYHSIGQDPNNPEYVDNNGKPIRGFYGYPGPYQGSPRSTTYDEDWGTPKLDENGILGSAKFSGSVTLHADTSPKNQSDDVSQPKTTWFICPDIAVTNTNPVSQYDENFMKQRYDFMAEGHPSVQHDEAVGTAYPQNWQAIPNRNTGGGTAMGQGFGPYNLEYGDSIHIVFAEGIAGISWEKGREVGANWFQYWSRTGSPDLKMPDGSTTTDHNAYKKAWFFTGKDSLLKTYRNAIANYTSGYNLPQAPPPPSEFTVVGGGDRIQLTWSNTAASFPHFGGYVIYRSQGNVMTYTTNYEKLAEISDPNVTSYDDMSAKRGFDYYYYIQAKDDGKQVPGTTLYSSMYWTVTSIGALLGRPAVTAPPAPPDNDSTHWKYFSVAGDWDSQVKYYANAIVSYSGRNYICIDSTEENAVQSPGADKKHWQATQAAGSWASGNAYNAGDIVTYNGSSFVTPFSISGGSMLDLVRVVPNPYDIRSRFFQFGDQYQYDRIAFYGLPPRCKLRIFTERGDLVWEKEHTRPVGDEVWDCKTSSGQIIVSGIYILYVENPDGKSVIRKFVVIR